MNDGDSTGQALTQVSRGSRPAARRASASCTSSTTWAIALVAPLLAVDRRGRKHLANRQAQVLARRQRDRAVAVQLGHARPGPSPRLGQGKASLPIAAIGGRPHRVDVELGNAATCWQAARRGLDRSCRCRPGRNPTAGAPWATRPHGARRCRAALRPALPGDARASRPTPIHCPPRRGSRRHWRAPLAGADVRRDVIAEMRGAGVRHFACRGCRVTTRSAVRFTTKAITNSRMPITNSTR